MSNYLRNVFGENRRDEERVAIVGDEEDGRFNKWAAMTIIFMYVSFIAFIVYGAIHLKDCPAQSMLPISYIVIGCLGLLIKILSCPYDCKEIFGIEEVPKSKIFLFILSLLTILLLGWFFASCYWYFKMDPDTKAEDHDKPNYCASEFYRNAYWTSVIGLTLFGLGFFAIIVCVSIAACCIEN